MPNGGAHGIDTLTHGRRKNLFEFGKRGQGCLGGARRLTGSDEPKAHRHRDRVVVREYQGRQRSSGREPVSTEHSGCRLDAIPEIAQPFDVAADRAHRHVQPICQFGCRPVPV